MSTRVNSASLGASSVAATPYSVTIPAGTGIVAGDLIVVCANSNGTHVLNGQSVQDSTNLTPYTTLLETRDDTGAFYMQTFWYVAAANIPDGATITYTPFAGSTANAFCVDIFRFALGTITNPVVGQSNAAATSQPAPALAAAPAIGNLVLTFDGTDGGQLTPGAAFTLGSNVNATPASVGIAYASADGVSTFGSTWTEAASHQSATQTVAFQNAGVGVPYTIGATSQAAGSSSTVVNVTTTTNTGDALFCCIGTGAGSSVTPTGVVDSKSHTWTLIGSFVAGNSMACYIYQSLHAVTTLVGGVDTVTVSWSGTSYAKFVEVIACAGVNQTTALDLTTQASGVSNAPTLTTAALTNNNELVLGVVTAGAKSQGITWASGITAMDANLSTTNSVFMSVGTEVINGNTNPVTFGATLAVSAVWAELVVTLVPDPPAVAASAITINNASPLPQATVNTAYSDVITATGGAPPYTWTATGLPPGMRIESGATSAGDITYVGANVGPQADPNRANFQTCFTAFGPLGCYKYFYSSGGSGPIYTGFLGGNVNGGSFNSPEPANTDAAFTPQWIATTYPGTFVYVSWGVLMSAAAIRQFILSIPPSVREVGFSFQSEPEKAYGIGNGRQFVQDWTDQAIKIQNCQSLTTTRLTLILSSYEQYYQDGSLTNGSFIPPSSVVDVYGFDFYDRHTYAVGPDMSSNRAWVVWSGLVRGFGKPLALTEYGLSGWSTDTAQNARLQADWAYIKTAFGPASGGNPAGTVSQSPLYVWLYWNTGGTTFGGTNINEFLGPQTEGTWASIARTAGTQPATTAINASSTSTTLWGTPTTAGTYTTLAITARDSLGVTGNKTFTIQVNPASALTITSTSPLPGGTIGVAYSFAMQAQGGTGGYTWSRTGSVLLPNGLSISAAGVISGTPTSLGTLAPTLQVQDSSLATQSGIFSITISDNLAVTTTSLPAGTLNTTYGPVTLTAIHGTTPYTWQLDATSAQLPTGLALNGSTGVISGTPTVAGSFMMVFVVSDAAGATARSPAMPLAIATGPGGGGGGGSLPDIGRRLYGGSQADWGFQVSAGKVVIAPGIVWTFWTASTGGTQYTDLTDLNNAPITSITTDSNGFAPQFFGPVGIWLMWADANGGAGPRRLIYATDIGTLLTLLHDAVKLLQG